MSSAEQETAELQARLQVLEQENSMLVERSEDFLLLGLISEVVSAETDIDAMFAAVLEKIVLLKGLDLSAICRAQGSRWLIESSYDGRADRNIDGHIFQLPAGIKKAADGLLEISGPDCPAVLGPDFSYITEILLLPFAVEIYGSGFLLLAVASDDTAAFTQCRSLFCRALDILIMNVSNRLLLQKYLAANAALGQELSERGRALKKSDELFRRVIEQAFEGFFLHDEQGRFLQVNQRACETLGYSKAELLQMRIGDLNAGFEQETLKVFLEGFNSDNYQQVRSYHRHKDGHKIPVEVNVSRVKLGNESYYLALVRDLSRQIEVEQLQQKFDLLLDTMPDVVCMTSPEGQVQYLNRAAKNIYNIGAEAEVSLNIAELLPVTSVLFRHQEKILEAIEKGIWIGESQLLSADNEIIPTLQTIVAPKNQLGEVENIFCIDRDLRELRRLEEQFVQAQKMEAVGTLVGGIAHDFNNFLAGVMGNVFLLLKKTAPGTQQERLKSIQQMCQAAAGMVSQLLIFARKDAVAITPLKLKSFFAEFGKMYQVLIPENICFELGDVDEELTVLTDLTQFQQIMVNLLTNARDALSGCANPTIGISIEEFEADEVFLAKHQTLSQSHLVCISVIDNGCGISPEIQTKIFEPFFTTKQVNKGTGLGLAMVYGAIKRQQGAIEIVSNLNQGTIVRVFLPWVQQAVPGSPAEEEGLVYGQGELLILADDDAFVRDSHKDVLIQLGYRVLAVADGQQAVETFQHQPQVALVISDIVMPNLDGVAAGQLMRKVNPQLPLLFISGYAEKVEDRKALPKDAEILKKPASIERLSQAVARLLRRS